MRHLQLTLSIILFISSLTSAQTVYTWIDDDGTRYFSDSPSDNPTIAITLPVYELQAPPPHQEHEVTTPYQQNIEQQETHSSFKATVPLEVRFTAPEPNSAVRSNNGVLNIQASLNRKLTPNEQLQLVVNAVSYGELKTDPSWQLTNLDRGQHSLSIQVFRDGKLIASSQPITVHLLRATIKPVKQSPNS